MSTNMSGNEVVVLLEGVSPAHLINQMKNQEYDLTKLQKEFKRHCPDYLDDLTDEHKSEAIKFCSKIINTVGPESKKAKKTGGKTWKFFFKNTAITSCVFVSTSKYENVEVKNGKNYMAITTEEAGLLAMDTFSKWVHTAYAKDKTILMTPLARARFREDDIAEFAERYNVSVPDLLVKINQSCQPGGQYLMYSDVNIAIMATVAATKNFKNKRLSKNIVTKLTKQYIERRQMPVREKLEIVAFYAVPGITTEFSDDE